MSSFPQSRTSVAVTSPGPDRANTNASRPVSTSYARAISRTAGSATSVPRMATVPPLPPPVIFAPNSPADGPAGLEKAVDDLCAAAAAAVRNGATIVVLSDRGVDAEGVGVTGADGGGDGASQGDLAGGAGGQDPGAGERADVAVQAGV